MSFSSFFSLDLKVLFPEIFLSLAILLAMIYGVFIVTSKTYNYPIIVFNVYGFSLFVLFFTALLVVNNFIDYKILFQNTFIHDDLSRFSKFLILLASMGCLILMQPYITEKAWVNNFEYYLLILFSILGLLLLSSSFDFISSYLAIEMQALAFYVLASFYRRSVYSIEGGLKYFILGSLSSGFLLFGYSLIYGLSGCTNLLSLKSFFLDLNFFGSIYIEIGLIFILAGFLFKIGAFPFHMWVPDVYEGSPLSTTIFFAIVPKVALFTFFIRLFFFSLSSFSYIWVNVLLVASLGSILIGAFTAIKQDNLKRLLAYSSIGHVGFMLLAICCNSFDGLQALFFYVAVYMLTSFPVWGILIYHLKEEDESSLKTHISKLSTLTRTNPLLAVLISLSFFSLAGIPPLVGFYSKVFVFFSALDSYFYFIVLFALVLTVISASYYINIVKMIYFEKVKKWAFTFICSKEISFIFSLVSISLFFLFLHPSYVILLSEKITLSLF